MEKKLFSNSVFSLVIIGISTGFGTNGDKHYEVVFSLAIVWMDGADWIDIREVIVIGQVIIIELQEQDSTAFQDCFPLPDEIFGHIQPLYSFFEGRLVRFLLPDTVRS